MSSEKEERTASRTARVILIASVLSLLALAAVGVGALARAVF